MSCAYRDGYEMETKSNSSVYLLQFLPRFYVKNLQSFIRAKIFTDMYVLEVCRLCLLLSRLSMASLCYTDISDMQPSDRSEGLCQKILETMISKVQFAVNSRKMQHD